MIFVPIQGQKSPGVWLINATSCLAAVTVLYQLRDGRMNCDLYIFSMPKLVQAHASVHADQVSCLCVY